MTRSELIRILSTRFPALKAPDVEICVRELLDAFSATLAAGHRIEIRGFGSFDLVYRKPRVGRNPASGQVVEVAGKFAPHFRAGRELRLRVDRSLPHAVMPKFDVCPTALAMDCARTPMGRR